MADNIPDRDLILVSGITASALYVPWDVGGLGVLWPNPAQLFSGGFSLMRLPIQGESGGSALATSVKKGGPLLALYGGLMDYLRAAGYRVWTILHDWRQPLAEDGRRLVQLIRDLSSRSVFTPQRVNIVCHSRGGLVTRYALGVLAASGELARVRRVVGLGVPHRGSLLAAYSLAGPYDLAARLHALEQWGVAFGFGPAPLGGIQLMVRSWPALYELLPDPVRNGLPPGVAADLYQITKWADADPPPYGPHLSAAAANWLALPDPPAEVDWLDVVGYGLDTPSSADTAIQIVRRQATTQTAGGDGTVPGWSSHLNGRRRLLAPTQHALLAADTRLWGYYAAMLADGLVDDVVLQGDVLRLPGG